MNTIYYGQFVIKKQNRWIGRKNIPQNWLTLNEIKNKAQDAVLKKETEAHISLFFKDNPESPHTLKGDFVFDFDGDFNNLCKVKNQVSNLVNLLMFNKVPFILLYSGHRGFKIVIPQQAFGLPDSKNLPYIYRETAKKFASLLSLSTLDIGIYNMMHIMRLTNTRHEKTGLFQTPITISNFFKMDPGQIKKYAETQHFITRIPIYENDFLKNFIKQIPKPNTTLHYKQNTAVRIHNIPLCVESMLAKSVPSGQRHNYALRILSILTKTNKTENEIYNVVSKWNENNDPPLPETEINYLIKYIFKHPYQFGCSDWILKANCPYFNKNLCAFYRSRRIAKQLSNTVQRQPA